MMNILDFESIPSDVGFALSLHLSRFLIPCLEYPSNKAEYPSRNIP
jgi:hypothetical protein